MFDERRSVASNQSVEARSEWSKTTTTVGEREREREREIERGEGEGEREREKERKRGREGGPCSMADINHA